MDSNEGYHKIETYSRIEAIFIFIFAIVGLFVNIAFSISQIKFRNISKEPAFLLVLNLILSDCGHLILIICHIELERIVQIEWPEWYEELIDYSSTLFWYCDLFSLFWIAYSRLVGICYTQNFKVLFSLENVLRMCLLSWTISAFLTMLPLTGVCCAQIFDIHYNPAEFALAANSRNVLRLIVKVMNGLVASFMIYSYSRIIIVLHQTSKALKKVFYII